VSGEYVSLNMCHWICVIKLYLQLQCTSYSGRIKAYQHTCSW